MRIITKPNYVINRGWERIEADINWVIETENQEAIEVLKVLFPVAITPKTEVKWKSQTKK